MIYICYTLKRPNKHSTTYSAISEESDLSQVNTIPISVRLMYVEVYLCLSRGEVVYILKWMG